MNGLSAVALRAGQGTTMAGAATADATSCTARRRVIILVTAYLSIASASRQSCTCGLFRRLN
ncbi:hypothetical protein [Ancylobacter lacus]|uniref:hypothetical protein n=1 Tax=Ancylobacter lacus TaxID=2579970 RepID=UPI001FE56504|nr:hypothetical protein [Ancylobacter lacus]